jgi:hypothetical protein
MSNALGLLLCTPAASQQLAQQTTPEKANAAAAHAHGDAI